MSILLACDLPGRICQVLDDYIATELTSIDTALADGITTPDIDTADFYQWDQQMIPEFPACVVRSISSTPMPTSGVYSDGFGQRVDALHRFEILFHATRDNANVAGMDSPLGLQRLLMRYVAAGVRVLAIMYEGLQTIADPTRAVTLVQWAGPATYGPEQEQADGAIVRTATLPIDVRLIEAR